MWDAKEKAYASPEVKKLQNEARNLEANITNLEKKQSDLNKKLRPYAEYIADNKKKNSLNVEYKRMLKHITELEDGVQYLKDSIPTTTTGMKT